ncbi:uncharacterized protein LOC110094876 [Dendrobium catenatum]|uniref:uncharacterized protein LOC110094876 n=1 Tax=Dendrobium catenatum TaxID=906689 RepID=UPI0009F4B6F5|nr:uncharacterized protein LOC110094876 [Dendrobium catenatum]
MGPLWDFFLLPSEGLSGGIMIIWRVEVASFSVVKKLDQCVIGDLNVFNKGVWRISTIYGSKETHKRRLLWECVQEHSQTDIPYVIGGYFNCMLAKEDKKGWRKFVFSQGPMEMLKFMNENDFHEVGFVGSRFNWCNNKVGGGRILERLDRCILNYLAINKIQIDVVRHLARVASDHSPIVLKIYDSVSNGRRCLKFEDAWLSFKTLAYIISNVWKKNFMGDDMEILNKKCKRSLKDLFFWSKFKLKEFSKEKDRLKAEISQIQEEEASEGWLDDEKLWLLRSKVKELNFILNCLNTWWRQRAKVKWIEAGDSNTKFFHTFANARRKANWISQVRNADGILIDEPKEVEEVFFNFF